MGLRRREDGWALQSSSDSEGSGMADDRLQGKYANERQNCNDHKSNVGST